MALLLSKLSNPSLSWVFLTKLTSFSISTNPVPIEMIELNKYKSRDERIYSDLQHEKERQYEKNRARETTTESALNQTITDLKKKIRKLEEEVKQKKGLNYYTTHDLMWV